MTGSMCCWRIPIDIWFMNAHQLCMLHAYYCMKLARLPDRMSPYLERKHFQQLEQFLVLSTVL